MSKQVNEPATKPGKYGTLYLYQIAYCDVSDSTIAFSTRIWAYDSEHAIDKFYSGEEGWRVTELGAGDGALSLRLLRVFVPSARVASAAASARRGSAAIPR